MNTQTFKQLNRRHFAALVSGLPFLAVGHSAVAASDPAEGYVGKVADDVIALANSGASGEELRAKFISILKRHVNLASVANAALGRYRNELPPEKKDEFYLLFGNYAAALFVNHVDDFKGSELKIISISKGEKLLTIASEIRRDGGGGEPIKWRIVPTSGGFRISDINIKGVWLTIATKKRFSDVLNHSKGDFEPLLAELREAKTW